MPLTNLEFVDWAYGVPLMPVGSGSPLLFLMTLSGDPPDSFAFLVDDEGQPGPIVLRIPDASLLAFYDSLHDLHLTPSIIHVLMPGVPLPPPPPPPPPGVPPASWIEEIASFTGTFFRILQNTSFKAGAGGYGL